MSENTASAQKPKTGGKKSVGMEKAAMFMLAIGRDFGKPIWDQMDEDEVRELSKAISMLGVISPAVVQEIFKEFSSTIATIGTLNGSYEATEKLLESVLSDDKVKQIMEEIRGPAGRTMWDKLSNINEVVLASYLRNEYPQTVAVILQKVNSDHAARILSALPSDFAEEVMSRLLHLEPVHKDVLVKIEQTLRNELMSNLVRTSRQDNHQTLAEIFNFMERNVEERFMSSLEEHSSESAEKVRSLMFTFEDLQRLDPSGVQTLLRFTDKSKIALALKGAPQDIRDIFFDNMSERASKIMRDDMEAMGAVRLKAVDEAQQSIVATAKQLADSGEIALLSTKEDDALIT